ncbi:hypothetical protein R0J89_22255, partial [Psychrobacter sp. SIMBA_152]
SELPASDFVITYTGNPNEVSIQPIDNKGEPLGTASLATIPPSGIIDSAAITSGESFGLELNVTGAGNAGDQFQVKLN